MNEAKTSGGNCAVSVPNLVERLREDARSGFGYIALSDEAADEIERLRALVKELADDLEEELRGHYGKVMDYPSEQRRFERDMDSVYRARAALR